MTDLRFLPRSLPFLLLFLLLSAFSSPAFGQTLAFYLRAEQTDADYEAERIEELIGLLESKDSWDRASTLRDLAALGPEARPAIPKLIELLEDETVTVAPWRVKNVAAHTLAALDADVVGDLLKAFPKSSPENKELLSGIAIDLGSVAREFRPLLRKEYDPDNEDSRITRLVALTSIDPTGETALPLMLETLRTAQDESLRRVAAECLRRHKTPPEVPGFDTQTERWMQRDPRRIVQVVKALLDALKDKDAGVRAEVIRTLATYPEYKAKTVDELIARLSDESVFWDAAFDFGWQDRVSKVAARALQQFPEAAEKSVPALVEWMLRDDPAGGFFRPEEVLADLIPRTDNPLEHAEKILKGPHPEWVFLTLARLGGRSAPLIEQLEKFADSDDSETAAKAKLALACIDERWHFPALGVFEEECASILKSGHKYSSSLFTFLANIGENAAFVRPAVENRLQLLTTGEESQRRWNPSLPQLVQIMARTGPADEKLVSLILADDDIGAVEDVEASLIEMCPAAETGLAAQLREANCPTQHRILCLRVLGAARAGNPELVPLVVEQLKSDHPAVREAAVEALGEIGTKNEQSVNALIEALSDPRVRVRAKVLESLAKFGDKAPLAVPHIIKSLSDDYLTVRVAAVRCLGELGPVAESSIGDLEKLKGANSQLLRETVAEALVRIEGE